MTWKLGGQICAAWKWEIEPISEILRGVLSHPALLLTSYPKIARFPPAERSTDLSTFFICPIHQNIPLSRHRRCAIIRVRWSRHIEKVIWGQNRTDLHKILLTDLWSFLTDLLEISDQPDCNSGSHWKLHSDAWDERRHIFIWFYPASNRTGNIVSPPWTINYGP